MRRQSAEAKEYIVPSCSASHLKPRSGLDCAAWRWLEQWFVQLRVLFSMAVWASDLCSRGWRNMTEFSRSGLSQESQSRLSKSVLGKSQYTRYSISSWKSMALRTPSLVPSKVRGRCCVSFSAIFLLCMPTQYSHLATSMLGLTNWSPLPAEVCSSRPVVKSELRGV